MTSHRTDLAKAQGLGSAKHGVAAFIAERATAIALVPLSIWGLWFAVSVAHGGYAAARGVLASPVQAAVALLALIIGLYHAMIGMRVVIEDYIHKVRTRVVLLLLNALVGWSAAAVGAVALLKIAVSTNAG